MGEKERMGMLEKGFVGGFRELKGCFFSLIMISRTTVHHDRFCFLCHVFYYETSFIELSHSRKKGDICTFL